MLLLIGGWPPFHYHSAVYGKDRNDRFVKDFAKSQSSNRKTACVTDKRKYKQGENVRVTLTNMSHENIFIIERTYIDAGVATIERKNKEGKWKAIELYAAAAASVSKMLKPGEVHFYIWKTRGYNRSDTIAEPGIYRIVFSKEVYTNEFQIKRNPAY